MNPIFLRDIVIAVLLSLVTAIIANEPALLSLAMMYLLAVIALEEYIERIIRIIHAKRIIKRLRNRKVLPPASKQD